MDSQDEGRTLRNSQQTEGAGRRRRRKGPAGLFPATPGQSPRTLSWAAPHPPPALGSPLRPLGRHASGRRSERGLWSVLSHPTPQKEHQLANLASQNELPKSPSSGVADPQMSRSTLRVRHGLPSSPLLLWKDSLSSESTLLIPLATGPGFSQFPPPPLAQIPAFLGRQQATGMLGFPLCFLRTRTGLFFHPKPSRSPRLLKADLLKSAGRAGGRRAREGDLPRGGWQIFTQHLRCLWDSPLEGEMVSPKCGASC